MSLESVKNNLSLPNFFSNNLKTSILTCIDYLLEERVWSPTLHLPFVFQAKNMVAILMENLRYQTEAMKTYV